MEECFKLKLPRSATLGLGALILFSGFYSPALSAQSPQTPVSVVVFSDFSCPYSSELFFELEKVKDQYRDRVEIAFKQSPLPNHPEAPLAHRAALAAGMQGRFLDMAGLIYSNQQHLDRDSLIADAHHLHLNLGQFVHDFDSQAVTSELNRDLVESRAFGIEQTPTLFLAGQKLVGAQTVQTLSAAISKALSLTEKDSPADDAQVDDISAEVQAEMLKNVLGSRGDPTAPITIVEFTDFQCPYCRAAVAPLKQLVAESGRKVRWVVHNFPLDMHPNAQLAAEAAAAAGDQGKFWEMHDLLFANQSALKPEDLHAYAEQLHLDLKAFDESLRSHRFAGDVAADRMLGTKAGVEGTPTLIIGGEMMTGARSLPELEQFADLHLARNKNGRQDIAVAAETGKTEYPEQNVLGPKQGASVTLTWFTDVRSQLAQSQASLVRELAARYDGRVAVRFRAFPIDSHPDSKIASRALLAALKQGKFWELYDALAARRDLLDKEKILTIASGIGLDRGALSIELDGDSSDLLSNANEASARGILGAPVIFLNSKRVDGLQHFEFYSAILDEEMKNAADEHASRAGR
jgi:protein-disulfide isomerase